MLKCTETKFNAAIYETRYTTDLFSIQYFHVMGSYLELCSFFLQVITKTTFFDQRLCLTIPK